MTDERRETRQPRAVLRDFSKSLPMALMRTREAVMKRFRPSLRDHDITEQQWRVLRALEHAGPLEATELARRTLLLAPSLSRILRDLDARGLVERAAVKSDLRRTRIRVSDQGARLIAAIAPDSEATYHSITRRFGRDKLNALFALLNDLEQALEEGSDASDISAGRRRIDDARAVTNRGEVRDPAERGQDDTAAAKRSRKPVRGGAPPLAGRQERLRLEARSARRTARKE